MAVIGLIASNGRSKICLVKKPKGLYANIHSKRKRIERQKKKGGKVERMRKPGSKGAPTAKAFRQAKKTAKRGNNYGVDHWNSCIFVFIY